ncbi:hypothetical protein CCP4SC76_3260029 [Gammaproteobacteria bacterium]
MLLLIQPTVSPQSTPFQETPPKPNIGLAFVSGDFDEFGDRMQLPHGAKLKTFARKQGI